MKIGGLALAALSVAAVGLIGAISCGSAPAQPTAVPASQTGTFSLSGTVVSNPGGSAIPGARIDVTQVAQFMATADAAGRFVIDSLGGNTGRVELAYEPVDCVLCAPPCASAFDAVYVFDHEIVHTMGYYHTADTGSSFWSKSCSGTGRSPRSLYHAAIMYSRPPGNTDIDNDPTSFFGAASPSAGPPESVSCPLAALKR